MSECNCNGRCVPVVRDKLRRCCTHCFEQIERKQALPPELQNLWNAETGFWALQEGCKLTLKQRPKQCSEYNCHDYIHFNISVSNGLDWKTVVLSLKKNEAT